MRRFDGVLGFVRKQTEIFTPSKQARVAIKV